jgi:hypothetical protein
MSIMKICTICKFSKNLDLFYRDRSKSDGYEPRCKTCTKEKSKKHRDSTTSYQKIWREKNKDKTKKYNKQYNKERRESGYRQNYIKGKLKTDVNFKLQKRLRDRIYSALKNVSKTGSGVRDLGCSIEDLKIHIEKQFQPGMTWDNWAIDGWHIDHIRPLASFNLSDRQEFLQACHYTNLQPLWAKDNLEKSSKWDSYKTS